MVWLLAVAGCGDDGGDPAPGDAGLPATCSDGALSGDETDVDCGGSCDACPRDAACEVNADCVTLRCTGGTCRPPESCFDFELTEGETDVDCGGELCPGCRLMAACLEGSDCLSGNCNEDGVCIAECDDGIQNGTESDVDCGGSCAGCDGGLSCSEDEDCASGICDGSTCAASSCTDGVRNGAETDVDCGGTCGPCPGGGGCAVDGDCATLVCMGGMCAATTCTNGVRDGDESDVDCGGATCPGCLPGEACTTASDCGGNPCTGGTCQSAVSCLALLTLDGTLASGTFTVEPTAGEFHRVYCDMETAGGGWTLVGASEGDPLNDQADEWYPNLETLFPEGSARGVWSGMRPVVGDEGDTRFSCKRNPRNDRFDVDLVFYANDMYDTITAGTDGQTCFFVEEPPAGELQIVPPRSNELAAEGEVAVQRRLEPHGADGRLVGEDACGDPGDFTVDFDDRGMGGNQSDGTDWGESNSLRKCGTSGLGGGAWFVWVRESNPECADGVVSGFESDVDCGGPCAPCADGVGCVGPGDCTSFACSADEGVCLSTCENGFLDDDESDVDCGGACDAGCRARQRCGTAEDCAAGFSCDAGLCLGTHCANATIDGDETALDCGGSCLGCPAGAACVVDLDCSTGTCLSGTCDFARTCRQQLAGDPSAASGTYTLRPEGPGTLTRSVYCDMDTDGGGWTLVASSRTFTFDDASSSYYTNLSTIDPPFSASGVWNGLRGVISGNSDMRFVCKDDLSAGTDFTVDLSFYDVGWYREFTTGSDASSCFSESDGFGADPVPARRDNVADVSKETSDNWDAGYLEGEDSCFDTGDFTVDFDDRGMDSNQRDGTDWGEDDSSRKCGVDGLGSGQWFLFVREPAP